MAEPTVQQPVGRRIGVLARAVPLFLRKARGGAGSSDQAREPVRPGIISVQLDLVVTDADDAAAALDRVAGVLRPGDHAYLVDRPEAADPRVDDRPFTIWA
ncbi:hypothetical protein AB1046_15135 [Promicromonospora sp. Populi]|uniref:hypothetical protein n=1 Tax=Promicromonospora sp. Populi TaxID=3239420 RepID=UPI0034E29028